MKIVPASFEILDHLDQQSLPVRIEHCGRICYKSEDRITPESALPFVEKAIKSGHNSVLEMGVVTLEVNCDSWDYFDFLETIPKYLQLSKVTPNEDRSSGADRVRMLITGSIRAWREMLIGDPEQCGVVLAACALLRKQHPYFFDDITLECKLIMSSITVRKVPLEEVERLPADLLAKHRHIAVKFIVNRAISHEICRHRAMAILQTSQRYCNYASGKFGNEVTFIRPSAFLPESSQPCNLCVERPCDTKKEEYNFAKDCPQWRHLNQEDTYTERYWAWYNQCRSTEKAYLTMIGYGASPQEARTVLPNSCKTELIIYANLEQWRHIFKLRCSKAAEPSMREVMIPLREEFAKRWPEVFGNE
jgi:thymidylate synthase (FAD)